MPGTPAFQLLPALNAPPNMLIQNVSPARAAGLIAEMQIAKTARRMHMLGSPDIISLLPLKGDWRQCATRGWLHDASENS
jgi:hypothetical protein